MYQMPPASTTKMYKSKALKLMKLLFV